MFGFPAQEDTTGASWKGKETTEEKLVLLVLLQDYAGSMCLVGVWCWCLLLA